MAFAVEGLGYAYPGSPRPALHDVALRVHSGRTTALLGPNGCGKSTLLRCLVGELPPSAGTVRYQGRIVSSWERREMARSIGVVPQREQFHFPTTVHDLVAMGRFPHTGWLGRETPADRAAVSAALHTCGVAALRTRSLSTLSGGELQRVRIARALAQEPETLMLDEPTTSLDMHYEMEIFELLGDLTATGMTVVMVTHHLNLAARYADELTLMLEGRVLGHGPPSTVFERSLIERVFQWPVGIESLQGDSRHRGTPQIVPRSKPLP